LFSSVGYGSGLHSQPELTQVMIGVPIGPSLPINERHRAKQPVSRLESVACGRRDAIDASNGPRQISVEIRRPGSFCPGIMQRIGRPTVRPRDGGPQGKRLHDRTTTLWDSDFARARAQNHRGRVTQVTEHLVRCQCSPTARAVRARYTEPLLE
jgi:hypothetical protein